MSDDRTKRGSQNQRDIPDKGDQTAPVKDANPPQASTPAPAEVPKVGSRDAPGG